MARGKTASAGDVRLLERELARLRGQVSTLERRLADQERRLRESSKASEAASRRQQVVLEALGLGPSPRKGDRGVVRDLQESIARLEDYLLKTADRIENILSALKQHREFLVTVNRRVLDFGTKDRIRLELDIMKNTLSILSLHGVEFDVGLVKEIDKLRASLRESEDVAELERAKADLDRRFDGELKKFDLDAIWSKKREIPGYG